MDKSLMSAAFKKDYIAHLAIGIFFFILIAELLMAVWLPMHLRSEKVWALQVARQDMIDMFDIQRKGFTTIKGNNQLEGEADIARKSLDKLAIYLRKYQASLDAGQIAEIRSELNDLQSVLDRLQQKRPFSRQNRINPAEFLGRLSAEGIKPVSPPESD